VDGGRPEVTARTGPDWNGVVLVDKPQGPTSFDVVREIRRIFRTKSAGHTGTLDPMATGLLPVCLGDATRIATFLTAADKEYAATVRFGATTDTLDAHGTVLETRDASRLTREEVQAQVAALVGVQLQTAPMYSARKVDGRRLYELAREGVEVEREARPIEVFSAKLLRFEPPDADVLVRASKGTYIRSLAETLGQRTGVGAHLCALRRTATGPFRVEEALPLAAWAAMPPESLSSRVLSVERALESLPALQLDERLAIGASFGHPIPAAAAARLGGPFPAGAHVRLLDPNGLVIAVGESDGAAVRLARVLRARTGPGASRP
jgi:tRNA pseudouridine55 synthase